MRAQAVQRLFIGGLATDYCVLYTVRDALAHGYTVFLLTDGSRAVNVNLGDGPQAEEEMTARGAMPITLKRLAT